MSDKLYRSISSPKFIFTTSLLAVIAVLCFIQSGCVTTTTEDPTAKIEKIAKTIQIGTGSATSIGLLAIPNEAEADEIANLALGILDNNILPILNGDEAGIINGLDQLLTLSAFDSNPKLAKLKIILETALPLLRKNIPNNLIEQGLTKVPDDVKAYLKAFFNGIKDGIEAYLGEGGRAGNKFSAIRKKLAE